MKIAYTGHSHLNRIKSWLSLSTGSYLPDQWKSNVCIWSVSACSCIATTSHTYGTLANSTTTTKRNQRKRNKTRKNNKEEREEDGPVGAWLINSQATNHEPYQKCRPAKNFIFKQTRRVSGAKTLQQKPSQFHQKAGPVLGSKNGPRLGVRFLC